MDFQTVIFNRFKKLFTEGTKAGVLGTLGVGGLAATGYYANKGVNWVQGQKEFKNPLSTPDGIARQTASDNLAKYGSAGPPHLRNPSVATDHVANTVAPHAAGFDDKVGNAAHALSQQAGAIKDMGKSAIGHAADFTTTHPGAAIAAGAIGTAAWLARRRALKKVSRGF